MGSFVIGLFELFSLEVKMLFFSSYVLNSRLDFSTELWNEIVLIVLMIMDLGWELNHRDAIVEAVKILNKWVGMVNLWLVLGELVGRSGSISDGLSCFILFFESLLVFILDVVPLSILLVFNVVVVRWVRFISCLEHHTIVHFPKVGSLMLIDVLWLFFFSLLLFKSFGLF